MSIDINVRPEHLGARLRNARLAVRHTQDAVAQALGIARSTIASMESGKRPVEVLQLRAFAEFYGVSEAELLGDAHQPLDLEVKFRSSSTASLEIDQAAAAATLSRLASASIELESVVLGTVPQVDYPMLRVTRDEDLEQQAEDAAVVLRQRLGVGSGPLPHLLNLMESELGLRVFERPLPSVISGAVAFDAAYGGFVLLNSLHSIERRRNTAAHEVAHPLLRRPGLSILVENEKLEDREDKFCDAFGRALLMPASAVRRKHSELRAIAGNFTVRHILVMALYFVVSVEAMTRKLEALSLIPRGMFDSLKSRGLSGTHLKQVRKEIRADPPAQFSSKTYLLAGAAYDKELLSSEQLARMLDVDLVQMRTLLRQFSAEGEVSFDLAV